VNEPHRPKTESGEIEFELSEEDAKAFWETIQEMDAVHADEATRSAEMLGWMFLILMVLIAGTVAVIVLS
jgi:hypothetical protein